MTVPAGTALVYWCTCVVKCYPTNVVLLLTYQFDQYLHTTFVMGLTLKLAAPLKLQGTV